MKCMCNPLSSWTFLTSGTDDQIEPRIRYDPKVPEKSDVVDDELSLDEHVPDIQLTKTFFMDIENMNFESKDSNKLEPELNSQIPILG